MALTCPECGVAVAPGTKFCPECGAKLAAAPASREVRKVVTVLFADVTGSTALGEQLDPEALRSLMNRYFARMRGIIESHGGTVEKFIGDAVMAVFGIPAVHEDDALRAVRAAWEIREALGAMNAELEAERGIAIRFRTGVNTGEVVAGDASSGTTLVTGDTVNTAARLEQAAPPGGILLGRLTYSLVRDAVDAEQVDPVAAKGKAEPVEAYRLVAVRAGAEGRARHLDAPMVGRDRELALLTDAWRKAVDERTPHLLTLVAPAGAGKSRLVREFIERVRADGGRTLVGRCLSYGEGITYWPVRELVHAAAGITEGDDRARSLARVATLLDGERDAPVLAAKIAAAIGLSAGAASQEELFWAVRRLLEHLAGDQPTLVVLEDLHWAEDTLLDLVDYVVDLATDVPLLLLATARPDLVERRPSVAAIRETATVLRLEPLGVEASGSLLAALPGGSAVPTELRTRILGAAEGNPLYVEELLGLLRDEGTLRETGEGTWTAAPGIDSIAVPASITALLGARLEALPADERGVAQRASVIGRSFEVAALADLDPANAALSRNLLGLVRKELLRPDRAVLSAGDAFRFRHVLIRDAAYEALPKASRADLHERFAGWLERVAGDRLAEVEEIVGYHLEHAWRYRVGLGESGGHVDALAERAGRPLAAAGRRAHGISNPGAEVALLERARALLRPDSPGLVDLLLDLHNAYAARGSPEQSDAALADARTALRPETSATARYRLGIEEAWRQSREKGGSTAELRRIGTEALAAGEASGDDELRSHGLRALAWTHGIVGELMEERPMLERLVDVDRRSGALTRSAGTIGVIAHRLAIGPWPVASSIRDVERMQADVERSSDALATVLLCLGMLEMLAGQPDASRARIAEAKRIADEIGLLIPTGSADWAMSVGIAELLAGDPVLAIEPLRWARVTLQDAGAFGFLASVAPLLAQVLVVTGGDPAEVDRMIELTRQIAAADDLDAQVRWRLAAAARLSDDGRAAEARQLIGEARRAAADSDWLLTRYEIEVAAVRVGLAAGDGAGAATARTAALDLARAKGSEVLVERVIAL